MMPRITTNIIHCLHNVPFCRGKLALFKIRQPSLFMQYS